MISFVEFMPFIGDEILSGYGKSETEDVIVNVSGDVLGYLAMRLKRLGSKQENTFGIYV